MAKDYYETLGVPKTASKEEIKKAFHKLAHKHHPDKGGDEAKFKEASEAYQILSDDAKRAQYDRFGANGPMGGGGGGFNPGQQGWDFDFSGFGGGQGQGGFEFDLGDIFGDIFGGGGRTKRGRDISVDTQITFAESIFGTSRKITINKVGKCQTCEGSGAEPGSKTKTCDKCQGKGKVQETRRSIMGSFNTVVTCDKCHGKGQVPEKACKTCGGQGINKHNEEIEVNIPAGIEVGQMIRMTGQGEAISNGQAGDLYIKVHIQADKTFQRDGHNLTMHLEIKLTDSLLGASYNIKTLDGDVSIKIPEGISSGEILRVKNKGVPVGNRRGDLLVTIIIKTPTKLSKNAKNLVEKLKEEGI
jgi:molecular chaperone DnaJ